MCAELYSGLIALYVGVEENMYNLQTNNKQCVFGISIGRGHEKSIMPTLPTTTKRGIIVMKVFCYIHIYISPKKTLITIMPLWAVMARYCFSCLEPK